MLHKRLFTIWDSKVQAYMDPWPSPTPESAIREFKLQINKPGTMLNQWPEDYTLFLIGEWDAATGEIHPLPMTSLAVGHTLKDPDPQLNLLNQDLQQLADRLPNSADGKTINLSEPPITATEES